MFLWIPGRDGTRSKVTGNFLVNALHAFHRFNRGYHVNNSNTIYRKNSTLIDFVLFIPFVLSLFIIKNKLQKYTFHLFYYTKTV